MVKFEWLHGRIWMAKLEWLKLRVKIKRKWKTQRTCDNKLLMGVVRGTKDHVAPMHATHVKWNIMQLILRGSNFFFAALFCAPLGFNALLALPRYERGNKGSNIKEGGNKGIKSKEEALNCCYNKKIFSSNTYLSLFISPIV